MIGAGPGLAKNLQRGEARRAPHGLLQVERRDQATAGAGQVIAAGRQQRNRQLVDVVIARDALVPGASIGDKLRRVDDDQIELTLVSLKLAQTL